MKKRILLILTVCILLISAVTEVCAGVMADVRSFLKADDRGSWSMTAGMSLQAYPSFGEKRVTQFNQLIRHLQLNIQKPADQSACVRILVDDHEACSFLMNGGTEDVSVSQADLALTVFELLDDGAEFLRKLPEEIPETCTEKKIRQKLKKGTAVRSVSISIDAGKEESHSLGELTGKTEYTALKNLFGGWSFQGRHKITLLYDEEGRLLKVNYAGKAGESSDRLRNIRLEWRIYRSGESAWDELTLRTPTAEGADRDNWVVKRDQSVSDEGEALTFSFEYDQKTGGSKTGYRWEGKLSGSTGLSGEITYTKTLKNETEKLTIRPEMNICNAKQADGTLEIIHVSSKIEKEHFTLVMNWQAGEAEPANDSGSVRKSLSLQEAAGPETIGAVLRSILLHVPGEDLGYLKDGIPDADWKSITEAAGAAGSDR